MIGFIKKLFGAAPATPVAEPVPYKVEAAPVQEAAPMPIGIEAIVATPVVEEMPKAPVAAPAPRAKRGPAKQPQAPKVKLPQAPKVKLPQAPKPAGTNKGPRKTKSKPAV
jgi:hypothetical protein